MLAGRGSIAVLEVLLAAEAALEVLVELADAGLGGPLAGELVPHRPELLLFLGGSCASAMGWDDVVYV